MFGFSNSKEDRQRELVDRINGCTVCGLHRKRSGMPVPGVGPLRADVVFVGEAPGQQEEQQRYPFVVTAPAGAILTSAVLSSFKFGREYCFIMNTVCCRPKSDDPHKQNDKPTDDDIEACDMHFKDQIEIIDPKVIVALGGTAGKKLTGQDIKPGQYRGKLWWYEHWPVVCTWHPAYIARQGGVTSAAYRQVLDDLSKAASIRGLNPTSMNMDFADACETLF